MLLKDEFMPASCSSSRRGLLCFSPLSWVAIRSRRIGKYIPTPEVRKLSYYYVTHSLTFGRRMPARYFENRHFCHRGSERGHRHLSHEHPYSDALEVLAEAP